MYNAAGSADILAEAQVDWLRTSLPTVLSTLHRSGPPPSLGDVLHPALEQVVEQVPGATAASISWLTARSGRPVTPTATAGDALAADTLQYETGEGPCLEAASRGAVLVHEQEIDRRWPGFGPRVLAETAVRAVLSHPLAQHEPLGSLNVYSTDPRAFDEDLMPYLAAVAPVLGVALLAAESRARADNLEIALASARQIGMAVGILMATCRITDTDAFDLLRRTSQRLHRRVRDLAEEVVLTGALPE